MEPVEILRVTCYEDNGRSMYHMTCPPGMSSEELFFVAATIVKSLVRDGFVKDTATALEKLIYYVSTPDQTEIKDKKPSKRKTKKKKE